MSGGTVSIHHVLTTANPIKYHSTVAKRLLQVTLDGLTLNGVDVPGIGDKDKLSGKHVLRTGLLLTAHAQSQLPYDMGGFRRVPQQQMDQKTVQFMRQANLSSPSGYKLRPSHDEHTGLMR